MESREATRSMPFLHRLAAGLKEGFASFANGSDVARKAEGQSRSLQKQNSRSKRHGSVSLGYLEAHARDAISSFVQEKFEKGEAKPHVFTQFWLQFPKLEAGFAVLRRQLELRTGSAEGPLQLATLQENAQDFGVDSSSHVVQELCSKALSQKCSDIDFVGLVMLLLVVHLTEPSAASRCLVPEVRTCLSCLELAFTHFNSARRGKLDKREVGDALQYESAKAHTKEGRSGRTSNRLAHRLFEGLDWEHDNTITFENFLRGIVQLVQDEYGDMPDEDNLDASVAEGPPPPGGTMGQRRCASSRIDHGETARREAAVPVARARARSSSATGMVEAAAGAAAQGEGEGGGGGGGERSGGPRRMSGNFLLGLKGAFWKTSVEGSTPEKDQEASGSKSEAAPAATSLPGFLRYSRG